ncbi:MAG: CBS domain-containing protein [Nanoarchaeota archaeon]|nr:CBS domain-containing protein [Nanoarchaeota archaeon]
MVKAKAIMTENVITISEDSSVADAAQLMVGKHVKNLLVMKNGMPIAIVTENDLIRGSLSGSQAKAKIKGIMSKNFLPVSPQTSYSFIIKKLKEEKIKKFPVVDNDKLVGIITETDIVDATRDFTRFHRIMQEIILTVFGLVTAFFLFFFSPLGQSMFLG